jgi:hypothetical protein
MSIEEGGSNGSADEPGASLGSIGGLDCACQTM